MRTVDKILISGVENRRRDHARGVGILAVLGGVASEGHGWGARAGGGVVRIVEGELPLHKAMNR